MNEETIDRSSILELASYVIADDGKQIEPNTSLGFYVNNITITDKNRLYVEQLQRAIEADSSLASVEILRTSNGSGYSSPMAATCFGDGDSVYIQYRGTPDSGWVQNPISFGSDLTGANASDGVSSQIQADGLDFFDSCVRDYAGYGYSGNLIVGGHSQGGNVAEYVTVMSEYSSLIDMCVALDAPNHSNALYEYILATYGQEHLDAVGQKIISINGHNDYVNVLGPMSFASSDNTFYIVTNDAWAAENGHGGVHGWHDMLYMLDSETGRLMPYNAEQGPVGELVQNISDAIGTLPKEQQDDCALFIMALLEMKLGSKNWEDLQNVGIDADSWLSLFMTEEFVGFLAHGLPVLLGELAENPHLVGEIIAEFIPDDVKDIITKFITAAPPEVVIAVLAVASILIAEVVVIVGAIAAVVIVIANIIDFIITVVQTICDLADAAWQAVLSICESIKQAFNDISEFLRSISPGGRYASSNPYFKVDPDKLRAYAARIESVNNRLSALDGDLNGLYWQVGLLDILDILMANLLTSGSPTLNQVKAYLSGAASCFDSAESKAAGYMGG